MNKEQKSIIALLQADESSRQLAKTMLLGALDEDRPDMLHAYLIGAFMDGKKECIKNCSATNYSLLAIPTIILENDEGVGLFCHVYKKSVSMDLVAVEMGKEVSRYNWGWGLSKQDSEIIVQSYFEAKGYDEYGSPGMDGYDPFYDRQEKDCTFEEAAFAGWLEMFYREKIGQVVPLMSKWMR